MPRRKSSPELPDPAQLSPGTPIFQYCRDSGGQRQEKSVADQLIDLERHREERGWVLAGRFVDVARKGGDPGRGEFNRLLSALDERPVRARVVQAWDYKRLARDEGLGLELLAHCYRAGVPIDSYINPVPAAVRTIVEPLMFYMGAEESRQMGAAIARGMHRMIERGCAPGGVPPIGYTVQYLELPPHRDGTPRCWPQWIHDPASEAAVQLAWQMRRQGAAYTAIQAATGATWGRSTLGMMFHNPAYCGFPRWWLRYHSLELAECVEQPPVVPPYVSVGEFLQVQEYAGANPRVQFGGWPLGGLIFCGYCGAPVWAWAYTKGRRCDVCGEPWSTPTTNCPSCGASYDHRYGIHRYFCSGHQADARRCPWSRYVAGQKLERNLVQGLAEQFSAARVLEMIDGLNAALAAHGQAVDVARAAVREEMDQAEAAVQRLLDAVESGGASGPLLARLQEREQEMACLRVRLAALPVPLSPDFVSADDAAALAAFVQDDLPRLSRRDLQQFFQALDLRVTLYNDRAVAAVPWPPLRLLVPTAVTGLSMPLDGTMVEPVFELQHLEFSVAV